MREHRYSFEMPHSAARIWALFQDYDRWTDYAPMVNIPTLGMCKTQSNPQVAAATSAAMGVLTPQPCIPVTTSAWSPGASKVTINGIKALTDDSKCSCTWGGSITIQDAGSTKEDICG